jgi:hypothetical protein
MPDLIRHPLPVDSGSRAGVTESASVSCRTRSGIHCRRTLGAIPRSSRGTRATGVTDGGGTGEAGAFFGYQTVLLFFV